MRLFCIAILFIYSFCVSAETVNLNNSSVRSFVQWYSSKTGKPVIVNPDVKGSVTVFNADVNPTNIDDFFKSVLNANGFVMLSGNPAVVSLPSKLPSQMASDPDDSDNQSYDSFPPKPSCQPAPVALTVRNFKLTKVRASDVQQLVKIYLDSNGGGNVVDYPGNNSLIVSAPDELLPVLSDFINSVDVARDQVLIQSLMFETSLSDGVDLSFAAGSASGHKVAGGFNTSALGNALSTVGGSFGIFDGNVLALSLRAVQSNSRSKVIS
ncbi:secretin N-terminal domain-containing protein, partial [Escherichia coli]